MAPKRKGGKSKAVAKETAKEEVKEEVAVEEEEKDAVEEKLPSPKKARIEQTTQKKKKAAGAKKGRGKPAPKNKPEVTPKAAPKEATKPVIIIEASKECSSFKVRAAKVESGLKEAVPALEVKINPEKPRRGCFEIRDEKGTVFISLQNMPRPFTKMKNLDFDKAIEEIAQKIK